MIRSLRSAPAALLRAMVKQCGRGQHRRGLPCRDGLVTQIAMNVHGIISREAPAPLPRPCARDPSTNQPAPAPPIARLGAAHALASLLRRPLPCCALLVAEGVDTAAVPPVAGPRLTSAHSAAARPLACSAIPGGCNRPRGCPRCPAAR